MKTESRLALSGSIALLLTAAVPAIAVTYTWDGGGANDTFATAANWNPDGAPVSNISSTDLVFAGTTRLSPVLGSSFATNSIVFNNTAGAFTIGGSGFTVGAGGITNNDSQTQTFNNAVTVNTANSSVNATSGALTFGGTFAAGANTVTVAGPFATSFADITGTGTVVKSGTGTMTWAPGTVSRSLDFDVNVGTLAIGAASVVTLTSGASIDIAGGTLQNNGRLVLSGVPVTQTSGGFTSGEGADLVLQSGATFTVTGGSISAPGANVFVSGAGSSYSTAISQAMPLGSNWSVNSGGTVSSAGYFDVQSGRLDVTGAGSSFSTGSPQSFFGSGTGAVAEVLVDAGATATFAGGFALGSWTGARGELSVINNSSVTSGGVITVGTAVGGDGYMSMANGATWTHSGSLSIGTTTGSAETGVLYVGTNSTFTTGTVNTEVNQWGRMQVVNAALVARGNLNVTGGKLVLDNGDLTVNAGATLNVTAGGVVEGQSAVTLDSPGAIAISGAGSKLLVTDGIGRSLTLGGGATVSVNAGGQIQVNAFNETVNIGVGAGNSVVNIDGANSRISTPSQIVIGGAGNTGVVALTNTANINTATALMVGGNTPGAGSGASLQLSSGSTGSAASVTVGNVSPGTFSSLVIGGAGSTFTSAVQTIVGNSAGGNGNVIIGSGGLLNSGSALMKVNETGSVQVSNGGTLSVAGQLDIEGGMVDVALGGTLTFLAGNNGVYVSGGGTLFHGGTSGSVSLRAISVIGGTYSMPAISHSVNELNVEVLAGGTMTVGAMALLGTAQQRVLNVSGTGSSLTVAPTGIFQLGHVAATISNNATASLGRLRIDPGSFGFTGVTSTVRVESGADATSQNIALGTLTTHATPTTGALVVNGTGSTFTVTGSDTVTVGGTQANSTRGQITVENGGVFTGPLGFTTTVNSSGTLNIQGGSMIFRGPLVRSGGAISFTSGTLQIVDDFVAGSGGPLGAAPNIVTGQTLITSGATTVPTGGSLTISGGSFSTGSLANTGGVLNFTSGSLAVTGSGGLALQSGGPLGTNFTAAEGRSLSVNAATSIATGSTLRVNGGSYSSGSATLASNATLRVDLGVASVGNITNNGRIFAADSLSIATGITNNAGGRVTLENGTGQIYGAGSITNSGLVTGDGSIATAFLNAAGGEVRAEPGKTLTFTGATGNSGRLNLLGGTLQFTQPMSNAAGAEINGEGAIYFPTSPVPSSGSPAAGLNNAGNLNFSGGDTQVYGTVAMLPGSRLIVSGGATATFYDVFRHNGAEVKASALSSLVFFDEVRGAGSFTGGGSLYMEGGYSPGNSPASVTIDAGIVFSPSSTFTLEVGGVNEGIEYDHLDFGPMGSLVADGTLVLDFFGDFAPEIGQIFDLLDFAPGQVSGAFDSVVINANLAPGTSIDTSEVLTTGSVTVVPEPSGVLLLLGGLATVLIRRRRH